ncbi:MAG: 30S ribosomal protein S2 [Rhizobium sp. 63-7]|nr:MAG: 30S ribosomal protein S2 [Rhizobium sp. 63-7]
MALPDFSMRQLLEAGVHFGHQTHRWNPKMKPYIFGDRNNIHIIDLAQTVPMLSRALQIVSDTVARGGRVLFVGTKRQASEIIADAAKRSAQYYVNSRWLGGMMTNWKTISNSIARLRKLDEILNTEGSGYSKKERLTLEREREKLDKALGGIRDMGGVPDLIDYAIPGNDDASRAIALYCDLISRAAIDGIARQQGASGRDIGASAEAPIEPALEAEAGA